MDSCHLSGSLPVGLSALTTLTLLSLVNNPISGSIPDAWTALTRMQSLSVYYNAGLTGTIPSMIGALTSLKYVPVCRTHAS